MNWLLIVVLAILIIYIIYGYCKGMLRVLYSMLSLIITIVFVAWATPYISKMIEENTQIYQKIATKCEEGIRKRAQEQISEKTEEEADTNSLKEYGIEIPEFLEKEFFQKIQEGSDNILESTGAYKAVAEQMARFIVNGIALFIAWIICIIILHFLKGIVDGISKLPILKSVNHILGAVIGFVEGLLIVWLFFYFIKIMQAIPMGQELLSLIKDSEILTILFENNFVAYIIGIFL
ncbi:MAG: CvpA family protein [Lachnospiraceae bacterium]|nr:CvpA family protein [Lachnospiraceae bacterium]